MEIYHDGSGDDLEIDPWTDCVMFTTTNGEPVMLTESKVRDIVNQLTYWLETRDED